MFAVSKFFGRSEVRQGTFTTLQEAKNFIQKEILNDIQTKIPATLYRISEGADILQEFTQKDAVLPSASSAADTESSSQQKGGRQVFSPTPLSTTPRPKGIPQNWKNVDEEDKKKS